MERNDAKDLRVEIRKIRYFHDKIAVLKAKVDEAEAQIDNATAPHSPQGMEYIGAARALSFLGKESYINSKIKERDDYKDELWLFSKRCERAEKAYMKLLDTTDDKKLVVDFFSGKYSNKELEIKHSITNPSRAIENLLMDCL